MRFKKGDKVCITDYPFGRCIKANGVIVGFIGEDHYNVKLVSGFAEGKIIKYKYWSLRLEEEEPPTK